MTRHAKRTAAVVVTVCDRYDYLPQALDSVLAQAWDGALEIVVVDDGSDQDVRCLYEARFPNVRWLRQEHRGVCAARQFGSERAGGEFLFYLDDDDLWLPDRVATQLDFMEAHPTLDLAFCDMLRFSTAGESSRGFYDQFLDDLLAAPHTLAAGPAPGLLFPPGALLDFALLRDPLVPATVVLRRTFLDAIGGWDATIRGPGDCHDFFLRAAYSGSVGFQDAALVKYRRGHGRHLTHGDLESRHEEALALCRVSACYPPELQRRIRLPLCGYLTRAGARCFGAHRFELAAAVYREAARRRCLPPKAMVKWLVAEARARRFRT